MNPEQAAQQSPTPSIEDAPSENVPPTAPPSEAPATKSRLPLLIGGFIVILLILGGSYFFLGSKETTPSESIPTTSQTPPTTVPTVDPTANWKTYTTEDVGFSLKYPINWFYEENPDFQKPAATEDVLEVKVQLANFEPPFKGPAGSTPQGCHLDVLATNTKLPLQQFIDQNPNIGSLQGNPNKTEEELVGKEIGVKRIYLPSESIPETRTTIYITSRGKAMIFYFYSESNEQTTDCEETFNQILSTFTFLDQGQLISCTADTECPQGYFCDYGSSCQLPPPGQDFAICEETGSKTCLKECNTNADCVNETTCQQHSISDGDALFLKKACK